MCEMIIHLSALLKEFVDFIFRISLGKEFHTSGPLCLIDFWANLVWGLTTCKFDDCLVEYEWTMLIGWNIEDNDVGNNLILKRNTNMAIWRKLISSYYCYVLGGLKYKPSLLLYCIPFLFFGGGGGRFGWKKCILPPTFLVGGGGPPPAPMSKTTWRQWFGNPQKTKSKYRTNVLANTKVINSRHRVCIMKIVLEAKHFNKNCQVNCHPYNYNWINYMTLNKSGCIVLQINIENIRATVGALMTPFWKDKFVFQSFTPALMSPILYYVVAETLL